MFLRCLSRSPLCTTLKASFPSKQGIAEPIIRYSSYLGAKPYDPDCKIDYEVSKNPEEWKYVERLVPPKYIPDPEPKDSYPSGWRLQICDSDTMPYFVRRTKNHMIPVYLRVSQRGMRKLTVIRKIHGDVWKFESDLKSFLTAKTNKEIGTRIDEVASKIVIRGDYVSPVLQWFEQKGL